MKTYFYSFFLLILTSCLSPSGTSMVDLFDVQRQESPQPLAIETDSIRNPYLMTYHQGLLVFGNIHAPHFISVFDGETGRFLGDCASRGAGPEEFIHLGGLASVRDKLGLWDAGKSTVALARIDRHQPAASAFEFLKMQGDSSLVAVFQVTPVREDLFVAAGIVRGHRFALMDGQGRVVGGFGEYPEGHETQNTDMENGFVYQSLLATQGERSLLAAATAMGESIQFYDLSDRDNPVLVREFTFRHPLYNRTGDQEQPIVFDAKNPDGFIDLKATPDYCVGLFSGEARTDLRAYGGDKIVIFDWDGNPVKLITLGQSYTNLAVDAEKNRILLLSVQPETGDFVVSGIPLSE